MTIKNVGRRQFLVGASGFALALPYLASLFPREARGAPPYSPTPRFAAFVTGHGGVWGSHLYPSDSVLANTSPLYAGHDVRSGPLVRTVSGSTASLAPVLTASATALTDSIVSKMNVLRGLDIMFAAGHNGGMALGNFGSSAAGQAPMNPTPSIDQVMAWSPSFYANPAGIRERSMVITDTGSLSASYDHSSPSTRSGAVQPIAPVASSLALFDRVFGQVGVPAPTRQPVVDKIRESYRRLHDGAFGDARRLSQVDRQRLSDHMDRLSELERGLTTAVSCAGLTRPTASSQAYGNHTRTPLVARQFYQLYNEVIATAFMCGASRLATVNANTPFVAHDVDWHEGVAHVADVDPVKHQLLSDGHKNFFESVFVDLCRRLDVEEANGITYLDNSLLLWTSESGDVTHHNFTMPVVTAGSAAGFFNTGLYVDYRNRQNSTAVDVRNPVRATRYPGLPYNRFLASVLQSTGIAPSAFEQAGRRGYAWDYAEARFNGCWSPQMIADNSKILPLVGKGVTP